MFVRNTTPLNWLSQFMSGLRGRSRAAAGAESRRLAPERARLLMAVAAYLRQPLEVSGQARDDPLRQAERATGGPAWPQMRASLSSVGDRIDALGLIASLDSGALQPGLVDFSVQSLLDHVDEVFGPLATGKRLRWDVTPSIAKVRSNPVLLERMLSHLVDNAIRFTASGGVVVASRHSGASLLLQVWDTGPGIDPMCHERVFEAFFRDAPEADRGAGLGLPIVKSGARVLGIGVALRSVPGRGSCFSLRVPLAQARRHNPAPAALLMVL